MGYSYRELRRKTDEQLSELEAHLTARELMVAANFVHNVHRYRDRIVRVFKGRRVPVGVTGRVVWMGIWKYAKGPDLWGTSTVTRVKIRTEDGETYFTDVRNVQLAEEEMICADSAK